MREDKKKNFFFFKKKKKIFLLMGWHGPCQPYGKRMVFFSFKDGCGGFGFWSMASKKFRFFASYLDKYLQNKLKQHKTNKIKAIKLVGCLPRSARLKSLA